MKKSTAKPPAVVASQAVSSLAELDRELALARSGGLALADLMNRAEALNHRVVERRWHLGRAGGLRARAACRDGQAQRQRGATQRFQFHSVSND